MEKGKVVKVYGMRRVMEEERGYWVYGWGLKGSEIEEGRVERMKGEVDRVEMGEMGYDWVEWCGYEY